MTTTHEVVASDRAVVAGPPAAAPSPTVVVVGLGRTGLQTAVELASGGADVVGVDTDPGTVAAVDAGRVPFVGPDLERMVSAAVRQGRLRATTGLPPADVYVVAVPTPVTDGHRPDLSYVQAACDAISRPLVGGELVVLASISPPGTTQLVADRIMIARPDLSLDGTGGRPLVHVAYAPTRALPARVVDEPVTDDRVVGGLTPAAAERARDLYASSCRGTTWLTDALTAEMSRLVQTTYRDVNTALANELSLVCDQMGLDVTEIVDLANRHPQVDIPRPGAVGHGTAVDPWFVVAADPQSSRLIRTAREVNDAVPAHVVEQVVAAAQRWASPRIACLGLTSEADDVRQSPAVQVVHDVLDQLPGAVVEVVEPHLAELPEELVGKVTLGDLRSSTERADVVVLLVDHAEFAPAGARLRALPDKVVVDTRGAWR